MGLSLDVRSEISTVTRAKTPRQSVVIAAKVSGSDGMQLVVAFNLSYGMSGWLALAVHAVCVEFYVSY